MSQLTWDVARAGGFTAYLLVTLSVLLGLVLSLKWRNAAWPRFLTSDVHQHLALLALVFTAIHGFAVWIDPFQRFSLPEILVPLQSHYRPLWIALGIVAGYLMVALYVSEYLRPRIGYSWWRRLHFLTFGVWLLSTAHGLGTGSDSKSWWAFVIYASSFAGVGTLLAARLLESRSGSIGTRLAAGGAAALIGLWGWNWALTGPLQPGWNTYANAARGSGVRDPQVLAQLAASATSPSPGASPIPAASGGLSVPLAADVQGTIGYGRNESEILLQLALQGQAAAGARATMTLRVVGDDSGATSIDPTRSTFALLTASGTTWCQGRPVGMVQGQLVSDCQTSDGTAVQVVISLTGDQTGRVTGTLDATAQ
ncbi:MAG TPA: ferric reductase-like transmembrane domain-containing protein [Candidatus Nitrosotalea sp.]|nr:ferric reductase-like transmembrane domain-containing protein [Candidatus Nitrosotalea sp.]